MSRKGIRCNCLCPGTVETPSLAERIAVNAAGVGSVDAARAAFVARQPMGRLGTPEEIAALVVYLSGDAAQFMTGPSCRHRRRPDALDPYFARSRGTFHEAVALRPARRRKTRPVRHRRHDPLPQRRGAGHRRVRLVRGQPANDRAYRPGQLARRSRAARASGRASCVRSIMSASA